jgi:hypothetical protein
VMLEVVTLERECVTCERPVVESIFF